jgi:hypothetical protein
MEENTDRPSYEPETAQSPASRSDARLSSGQRLWRSFTSPGEVFEDISKKPTWLLCMVCYIAVVVLSSLVIYSHMDHEANLRNTLEMMNVELPEEAIEDQIASSENRWFLRPVLGGVFTPVILLVAAAVFFLMLKLMGSDAGYPDTLSTMLHAYWPPKLISSVLLAAIVAWQGSVTEFGLLRALKSSVAGLLPEDASLPALTLASFIDVFRIWSIVLLVIGFGIVAKISRQKATVAALVPWVFVALVSAGLAALPGLFAR